MTKADVKEAFDAAIQLCTGSEPFVATQEMVQYVTNLLLLAGEQENQEKTTIKYGGPQLVKS